MWGGSTYFFQRYFFWGVGSASFTRPPPVGGKEGGFFSARYLFKKQEVI